MRKIIAVAVLFTTLALTGLGCKSTAQVPPEKTKKVALEYWGVFTDSDDMNVLIKAFQARHPNILVNYRKFRPEEYEQKLLEAFAEDRGPDLFSIHNDWLPAYQSKLTPMPAMITFAVFTQTGGGVTQKTEITLATKNGLTIRGLRDQFIGVVEQNVTAKIASTSTQPSIWALPFYLDSLAMYYNRDLINQNGFARPAADWGTLQAQTQAITRRSDNVFTQSGVAMGSGANVHRAGDVLASLMMQNGARMTLDDGTIVFNLGPAGEQFAEGEQPGTTALHFYTDFANPDKSTYTWNRTAGDALQAFAEGRVGYYFGYSYDLGTIRSRNPKFNFDVASLPQINPGQPKNVVNYWMEAVSKKSKQPDEAWLFIMETATDKDAMTQFLARTKRISALNELLQTQLADIDLGVFAKQALTGQTWYYGKNAAAADQIMNELIDDTIAELANPDRREDDTRVYQNQMNRAAARLNDTL